MNKVLIIDDEPQIRRFLRISLGSQGYVVLEAASAQHGLSMAAVDSPDMIVLDLGLPDQDGKEVLRELRSFSEVPVLILSVRNDEAEKVWALDHGANDYVVKPFGVKEFLARVRVLLRAFNGADQGLATYDDGRLRVDLLERRASLEGEDVHFSRRELELLWALIRHRGRLVTQQQLLRELWGPAHLEDTQYLRVFIGRLRAKLGDDPANPHYIETEPGVGYRFLDRSTGTE